MRLSKARVAQVVDADFGQRMLEASDRAQAGNSESDQVWNLLVTEIEPDPDQPRRHFDPVALRELADDITRRGVLQPLVVRPTDDGRYRIIVGERRWRASQLAEKPRVPCLVRDLPPDQIREAQLVENVLRQGLSDIERGLALRQLYDTLKQADRHTTWEAVAARVGLTRMRIHHLYTLSLLPPAVIARIQTRQLSGSHGVELARLHQEPMALEQLAAEASRPEGSTGPYGLSVAALRRRVSVALAGAASEEVLTAPVVAAPAGPASSLRLSPARLEKRFTEITAAARRPGLPRPVRDGMRQAAEELLRFLDAEERREQASGETAADASSDTRFVKPTLQNGLQGPRGDARQNGAREGAGSDDAPPHPPEPEL